MYSAWTATEICINDMPITIGQILNSSQYPIRTTTVLPVKKGDIVTIKSVDNSINTPTSTVRFRLFGMRML